MLFKEQTWLVVNILPIIQEKQDSFYNHVYYNGIQCVSQIFFTALKCYLQQEFRPYWCLGVFQEDVFSQPESLCFIWIATHIPRATSRCLFFPLKFHTILEKLQYAIRIINPAVCFYLLLLYSVRRIIWYFCLFYLKVEFQNYFISNSLLEFIWELLPVILLLAEEWIFLKYFIFLYKITLS